MPQPVQNIIFDLGGVILDVDYNLTADAFRQLGVDDFDNIYSQKKQEHFFDDFEKGIISEKEFRQEIRKYLHQSITDDEIDKAWNSMILSIPEERYLFLKGLSDEYNLFLLSNTNEIHIRHFETYIADNFSDQFMTELFSAHYYSSRIGKRKPDKEVFDHLMNENRLSFDETIFIDDSIQHVEGARSAGVSALYLSKEQDIKTLLKSMGIGST